MTADNIYLMSKVKTSNKNITIETEHDKCGLRNIKGIGISLVTRENETQIGEFPWVIAVMTKQAYPDGIKNVYQCSGSLIHPSVVVTAAHCVRNKSAEEILVRAGEWNTQSDTEPYPHQDRQVAEILIHENFTSRNLFNDIALLFLNETVTLGENINTVCLPAPGANYDRERCIATGWGKDKFGKEGTYQAILKRIELPIVPSDKCQSQLRETRLGKHFILNESFICAGGEPGKDTCKGDGGAPLVCQIPGTSSQYIQTGIVAWGIGCGDGLPTAYVNVPKLRNWIDNVFEKRNLDRSFYMP